MSPLRILIVDDHEAVRSGLRTLLSSSEWIISGEACDGLEAVEKTRSIRPDLDPGRLCESQTPASGGVEYAHPGTAQWDSHLHRRSDIYDTKYSHFETELSAQIRREAFGEDIGQNSWLTADEHDNFLALLNLCPGRKLLDVACGAAVPHSVLLPKPAVQFWASIFIAERSRRPTCSLRNAAWVELQNSV